ncbi:tRNA (guanosine(37)-N1)-methyltransferase TrmD [[Clostridium] polysaccharolyticum]|uniref:tRNA (guanine-N(1)-)-methyltransferase n=1 Tax=[Clostridium] polysaccharolyticum TaxID=29364 RepID=A0A1I0FJZ3_9FIRM|nr:tRNA (guanosine(37)-N1)-methyltransferase TrmD [[Clostridium] polysaccharolyticum]SET57871.1 tRNA (guanine37-N1)-methyltransferase [[Clostridium] polysaccharolyticum]
MNFYVLTLFPQMLEDGMRVSVIGRALEKGLITLTAINIRDFARNKHGKVDDYPYGGGAGMVMQPGPVYDAYLHAVKLIEERRKEQNLKPLSKKPRVIYLTPQGSVFKQKMAQDFSYEEDLIFLCGHYEGIDERVLEMIVTDNISIGDYVLTGGEMPAMVLMDAISRLVPGVLNNDISAETESFTEDLLEYPQYTRPVVFMDKEVPEVLLSGHHGKVDRWRQEQSLKRTMERRPDLLEKKK